MKKRFFGSLALIMSVILLITGCDAGLNTPETSEEPTNSEISDTTVTEDSSDGEQNLITLCKDGNSYFDVLHKMGVAENSVRDTVYSDFYQSMVFLASMGGIGNGIPSLETADFYTPTEGRTVILLGECSIEESKQALREAAMDECGYRVINDKIVIYGHTVEEIQKAAGEFVIYLNSVARLDDAGKVIVQIPRDVHKLIDNDLAVAEIPAVDVGDERLLCDDGDNGRLIVANNCSMEDYTGYREKLEQASFELYAENTIKDNHYATYVKGDAIVNVWLECDGYMRVTANSGYDVLPKEDGNYQTISETGLTMVGDSVDGYGLFMFFRLADGRFVVIDGGMETAMGEKLYNELRKQAHDPDNIVIACWIFTHSHHDHIGAIRGMSTDIANNKYGSTLTIEGFMYNLPGYEQEDVYNQDLATSGMLLRRCLNKFPNSKHYKVHPGNTVTFADMHIEVLATHESGIDTVYPDYDNACNMCLRITVGDQVILITGDLGRKVSSHIAKVYGDYLNCDILQAIHHGGTGAVESANSLFKPQTVLYFNSDEKCAPLLTSVYNQMLIDPSKNSNFKNYIVSGDRVTYLKLPYIPGTEVIFQ